MLLLVVMAVHVLRGRSWSGAGTEEVEDCMRAKIRAWKFPAEAKGGGTYPFSYIFTK